MPKRYNWTEIDSLAEYLTADEIVKYLHLGRISEKTRARIEDLITRKKLTLKLNASKTLKSKAIQGNLSALKRFAQTEEKAEDPDKGEDEIGITQAEYARQHGVTRSAVNQMIRAGTIGWNGKTGTACRVWEIDSGNADLLRSTRIEKMKTETELKRQQIETTRRETFRIAGEIYSEAIRTGCAPITAKLVNLRLKSGQLSELRKIIESCMKTTDKLFNDYLECYLETGNIRPD